MNKCKKKLEQKIEYLRQALYCNSQFYSMEEILSLSRQLDKYIVAYYKSSCLARNMKKERPRQ